ncbi:TPA: hypothetical protein ACPI87_002039 [Haemophilus influenzae]|uniref:Uncharacterized protein n=1 Tax=Haemophilus influenzae TaxID=727 RepID=A0A2S9RPB6_HAEIF|nr:hypothetical protein [Haemophilus influenzae]PRI46752.1 hypothetical protein BVZ70_00709 [Haemophilus influenzae]PRI87953.1 hypothetical protein BV020_00356 [Haemophilus influenzae]PRI90870.1 hypothetical protein BV021_01141 [Haemophilus influenzae]PRJ53303.1 hypothetical protein BV094_00489 [Haemophilus influenzae]PRJ56707.1 hypothetical protein BV097_01625 [Haemophilus influenzae]
MFDKDYDFDEYLNEYEDNISIIVKGKFGTEVVNALALRNSMIFQRLN